MWGACAPLLADVHAHAGDGEIVSRYVYLWWGREGQDKAGQGRAGGSLACRRHLVFLRDKFSGCSRLTPDNFVFEGGVEGRVPKGFYRQGQYLSLRKFSVPENGGVIS